MQQLGMSQCVSLSLSRFHTHTHTHTPEYVLVENKIKQNKTEINLEPYRQFSLNDLPVFNTTTKKSRILLLVLLLLILVALVNIII